MIKNIIKKLFYRDAPAQGAWFALNLWGVGSCLIGSLLLWMTVSEFLIAGMDAVLHALIAALCLILGLTVYFLALLLRFYYRSSRDNCSYALTGMISLYAAGLAIAIAFAGVFGAAIITLGFALWFFPTLLLPRIRWFDYLLHALCWSIGLVIIATVSGIIYNNFGEIISGSFNRATYDQFFESAASYFQLSGDRWGWFLLTGVLFAAAGYLLTAKILGAAFAVPFRRMFDKKIIALWALAAANYLIFAALAISADRQAAQELKTLAHRYGHPMTMEAVGLLYYGKDRPDDHFWQTIQQYAQQCDDDTNETNNTILCPADDINAGVMTLWREEFTRQNVALPQWEEAFDGVIPPENRQYQTGKCSVTPVYSYMNIKQFIVLEAWRIRFALEDDDIDGALKAYRRLNHAAGVFDRDTYMIGGLFWIMAQNRRLEAMELLLKSGKLSPGQLQTLAVEVADIDQQITPMYQRSVYGETVYCLNIFDVMDQGGQLVPNGKEYPPYRATRYFMPQLWWYSAVNRRYLIQYFISGSDAKLTPNPSRFYGSLNFSLAEFKTRFDWLAARARAAGVVIRAVEYQKQHGEYPKTLDNLPLDPFNGKPMQYRVGDCEIERSFAVCYGKKWQTKSVTETVPGVISWSVGSNQSDDNGAKRKSDIPSTKNFDDISFMIEIKP